MSMPIWVCLTLRRTSDILELTIKKNAAPSGGVFFSKVANGLCRLGTEPAADYNSSFTLTNSLIICQSAGSHSTLSSSAGKSHRAASLWSQRRKEPPVAVPPASEATSRGAEHSLLLPRFSCFRLPPAYKKRDPKRSLSFVELEKKGTACGRSASERGDEPRSGTLSTSPPLLLLPTPSSHKKRDPKRSLSFVELEGVEPSSKQVTDVLSTCLSYG